jgi:hypothetical protein
VELFLEHDRPIDDRFGPDELHGGDEKASTKPGSQGAFDDGPEPVEAHGTD